MKRSSAFTTLLRVGAFTALLAIPAARAHAQATLTGKVTDTEGNALGGAQVVIRELPSYGANTAENGTYTITVPANQVRGQSLTLVARMLGKTPRTRPITLNAGQQTIDFSLRDDPLRLDELVVTGVNEATSTRKLAFAVGRVSADQLQETPGVSALSGLVGKVAGVRVIEASGAPGAAPQLRLRGATSISGTQDPLVIIDGTISRATLADVSSEDIERIEVIKGAAASSLYGSDAANGVVQIFTKRGANLPDGKLLVTTRNEVGASFVTKTVPTSQSHAWVLGSDGQLTNTIKPDRIQDNAFPEYHDHQAEVIQPGLFYTNYISIGQRRGATNFNASFQNTHTEGVIFGVKGYNRQNFRVNVDQQLTPKFDLQISTFYGASDNDQAQEGTGSPFFKLTFLKPNTDIFATNDDGSPYRAQIPLPRRSNEANPLYELFNRDINTDRSRFTGSGKARWRMTDWLTAEGNYAFDQERYDFRDVTPLGFLTPTGQPGTGQLIRESFTGRTYNTGATLTAIKTFGSITNTTKLSYVYEDQQLSRLRAVANKLTVRNVPEFAAADPAFLQDSSAHEQIRNRNVFAITTFDIKDRYIFDGLIRRDGSSLFGPDQRWQTYYRLSGAWRANEDLRIQGFDEIRLRASYGIAGLRPGYLYQYETLTPVGGAFQKAQLGNRDLKPARSSEFEVGANFELMNSNLTVEYTYSQKHTKDQIQLVDLRAGAGFNQQWQNVGALKSRTHEIALGMQLMNTRDIAWVVNVVGDRTRQEITDYPLPERLNGFGQQPATFFLGKGSQLGAMWGNRWVRNIDDLYDDPAKAALSGPGQAWSRDSVVVNEEGFVVQRKAWRCREDLVYADTGAPCNTPERPIMYNTCQETGPGGVCLVTTNIVQIGDANPDFNASISTSFNYRRFAITGLVDWTQGGQIYNGTRQWPFQDLRDRVVDQAGKPDAEKKSENYYSVFYSGLTPNDFFVEPGTYVKVKELAVNYTLLRSQLAKIGLGRLENVRIGIVGRNLFTFTDYSGYDPEVSGIQGDPYQFRIDWFSYPHHRTFTGVVEIAF